MSWSIALIGKPENVAKALAAQSETMSGQSKVEFDSALPHLTGLVNENFGTPNQLVKLTASGHGYAENGEQKIRQCLSNLEIFYATLV